VVARGFAPTYTPTHIVPDAGGASIALKPHDLDRRKPERVVRGRVVIENGDPVARAIVEPAGMSRGQGGQFGGLDELGIDALAVTGDDGEFRLGVGADGDALYLLVKASFLAPVQTEPLGAGPTAHTIRLGTGVTITGRVVKKGRPITDVGVGIVQVNCNVIGYLGHFEFGTDRDGRFAFANIPAMQNWYLYGLMDGLKDSGSIPVRTLETKENGSTLDLGDIEVQPGYRLTGQLILADGKLIPPETRVLALRQQAWDSQTATVGPDGRFAFTGLPPEQLSLSTNIRGYHPSPKNASFDLLNRLGLLGTVRGDVDDLRFLLDTGANINDHKFSQEDSGEYQRRRDEPLRGAPVDK
jgi:hypothetical protein